MGRFGASYYPFQMMGNPSGDDDSGISSSKAKKKKVVIVGAGIGGLATAARIKASTFLNDCEVTIVEKNAEIGGRCGSFSHTLEGIGTFRHEKGPSLLLLPDIYHEIFKYCSKSGDKVANDYGLKMAQCVPAYQVVFEDGSKLNVGFPRQPGSEMTLEELESRRIMDSFEQGGSMKWDDYMRATSAFLDCGLPNFIEQRFDLASFPSFIQEALRDFGKAWPLKPHSEVLDAIFESEKLKALASFQDLYVGLEPYRNSAKVGGGVFQSTAPAVFGLLAAIELHPSNRKSGVFAPVGGFRTVSQALGELGKELGTTVKLDTMVTSIEEDGVYIQHNDDKDGVEFLPADLIVCNADLPYATKSLLDRPKSASMKTGIFDWDHQFSFSSGVIAFHWCTNRRCDDLNTHNVFLIAGSRPQAELSWKTLRTNDNEDVDETTPFNFYVHRASDTDPSAAPDGYDSIMVLVPCRTLLRDADCAKLPRDEAMQKYQEQFSEEVIAKARKAVFQRLSVFESLKDLEQDILDEVVDTPATWADQFHVGAGTPFALSHGFAQLSLTRPGAGYSKDNKSPNLLYCGASSRPGNGVPLVLIGAKQVAEKAIAKLAQDEDR
ncbi:unnamed protein product [Cylindrotheca closterium]|uniref:Amine oxidase n=1 Tax=Cylindrotheca closterium TaxID=2856 RepID=A0AAD2G8N9_9STRA|nr:unnamed protein product [Cylindrotheca closterium]